MDVLLKRVLVVVSPIFVLLTGCSRDGDSEPSRGTAAFAPKPDYSEVIKEVSESGFPVELEQLEELYPALAPEANAAVLYHEAFHLLSDYPSKSGRPMESGAEFSSSTDCFDREKLRSLKRYFDENEDALEKVREAAVIQGCRYQVDFTHGSRALLPHLRKLRNCSNVLMAQTLVLACEGESENAIETIFVNIALAESLRNEPLMLSQVVRGSAFSFISRSIEGLLNRLELTDSELQELQSRLDSIDIFHGARAALVGEQVMYIDVVKNWEQSIETFRSIGYDFDEKMVPSSDDLRASMAFFQRAHELFKDPLPFSREKILQFMDEIAVAKNQGLQLTYYMMPSTLRDLENHVRTDSTIGLTKIGIAVKRYLLANGGKFPEELGELAPYFEGNVPADSFTGSMFELKRRSPSLVQISGRVSSSPKSKKPDITFSVRK